jgi:hypothetical protein
VSERKPPFIPRWLEDLGLSQAEHRVLVHLWSHNPGFRPSGPSIARTCRMDGDYVWIIIKELERRGLIERKKAGRNQNTYAMIVPPVTRNDGVTQPDEPPETAGLLSPEMAGLHPPETTGRQSPEMAGCIGMQVQGTNSREPISKLPAEAEYWNTFDKLQKVKAFTTPRTKSLNTRRKEPFWNANWRAGIEKIAASSFATGGGDKGWKATFDWLLKPDSLPKVIEGNYDDRPTSANGPTNQPKALDLSNNRRARSTANRDTE